MKDSAVAGTGKDPSANMNQFYRLHYPQKKRSENHNGKFRAKSVISVVQKHNPEETPPPLQKVIRKKPRLAKMSNSSINAKDEPKDEPFSFKQALNASIQPITAREYLDKYRPRFFGGIEELAKRNAAIRQAWLRCKEQKSKISKIVGSQRQPQATKMDYLQLKRQELEQQKSRQIRQIYDQFFRKQYESRHGEEGFGEFADRVEEVVSVVHRQLFGK